MEKNIINRMLEILDIQFQNCIELGATSISSRRPAGGDEWQNSFYYGHLNLAEGLALEMSFYVHRNIYGKHSLEQIERKRGVNQ